MLPIPVAVVWGRMAVAIAMNAAFAGEKSYSSVHVGLLVTIPYPEAADPEAYWNPNMMSNEFATDGVILGLFVVPPASENTYGTERLLPRT